MYSLRKGTSWGKKNKVSVITKKVVLILGAGASMPFGFPSGSDLKDRIVKNLTTIPDVLLDAECNENVIRDFREALRTSGKKSVDSFLEHRKEFGEIGKRAIAHELLKNEAAAESGLFDDSNWYGYLFDKLNTRFEEFSQNKVSILTFNYDRSLEYYLLTALQSSYGKTLLQCAEGLRSIPIIHLYGQLGELWEEAQSENSVPFGGVQDADEYKQQLALKKAASGIRIIHDNFLGEQFDLPRKLLEEAEIVCFLGFGYDTTNLERIAKYTPPNGQQIIGSAMGLTESERNIVYQKFKGVGLPYTPINHNNRSLDNTDGRDALQFLRHHCPFD